MVELDDITRVRTVLALQMGGCFMFSPGMGPFPSCAWANGAQVKVGVTNAIDDSEVCGDDIYFINSNSCDIFGKFVSVY